MRLEVFKEPDPEESVLRVRLVQDGEDATLRAVDEYGRRLPGGNLFTLFLDGIARCVSVDKSIGFPLDDRGRVIIRD